jgi:hypothetical protein
MSYGMSSGTPYISTATQPSPTAGFSEISSSPTGRSDYGVGSGSYGVSGGSYSSLGGGSASMSYGMSSGTPYISTATQPSPKAGRSDSSYSPTGSPDYGSQSGSYGMSGDSLNASLGRS